MGDPITEFLEMEKQGGVWGELGLRTAAVAAPIAMGMVMNEAYDAAKSAIGRSRGFKGLMEYNPGLKKQDRKKVQMIYNSLHNVSPDLATDPLVANSWVNRMMHQEEYIDPRTMSDLATAQQRMKPRRAYDFAQMASQVDAQEVFAPLKGRPGDVAARELAAYKQKERFKQDLQSKYNIQADQRREQARQQGRRGARGAMG